MKIALEDIRVVGYEAFVGRVGELLCGEQWRVLAYFAMPCREGLRFVALLADNERVEAISHILEYYGEQELTTSGITALQLFEREISELYGTRFKNHPWGKPVRFPFDRFDRRSRIENYPFYNIDSHELHLVNVGPVHAGVIEPGAFRFICNGEKILHLEIALGYQHRGIEYLICDTDNLLRRISLAESIAGDSAIAHSVALCRLMGSDESYYRVALEMERIAMHLADIGALCMDVAYQLGQVACEALRTLTVNVMLRWCGSRFGKGLIRCGGANFPLTAKVREDIHQTMGEVIARFETVMRNILNTPTLLARMEEVCCVTLGQAREVGAVGPAARSTGLERDARMFGASDFKSCLFKEGDLMSRMKLRFAEITQSYGIIVTELDRARENNQQPNYKMQLDPLTLHFSMTEGWRGEVVHCGVTDSRGELSTYKIYDPSFHNWMMLPLSVRGAQISDFPVSNKSYNLSYCGHDL